MNRWLDDDDREIVGIAAVLLVGFGLGVLWVAVVLGVAWRLFGLVA